MKMNFKEALIAHLSGEKVEVKFKDNDWMSFAQDVGHMTINSAANRKHNEGYLFRLAPRTITVNGVEVPAPESAAPAMYTRYFVPSALQDDYYAIMEWRGSKADLRALADGVIYLSTDACIARAKAMLLHE